MLACSDGDVSIFKSETNHLNDINAFPFPIRSPDNECRFKPTSGIVCPPWSSQALVAGTNPNIDILECLASVVMLFPVLRLRVRGRLPGNGRSQSQVLSSTSQGLSALPQRYYLDTGLHGAARTAAFRDADSAAFCKSESASRVWSRESRT
jgi:hypothetical protein